MSPLRAFFLSFVGGLLVLFGGQGAVYAYMAVAAAQQSIA